MTLEFNQAYNNWLTLIETVSEATVEQGCVHTTSICSQIASSWTWCKLGACMITCSELILCRSHLLLTLLAWHMRSSLSNASYGWLCLACVDSHMTLAVEALHSNSGSSSLNNLGNRTQNHLPSPHYNPYPKLLSNSFHDSQDSQTLCIHCGTRGHKASSCSATQSSCPECPLIIL